MLVYKSVQFFCYVCGVAFLIAALARRSTLHLSDAESFMTLLLIVCGTLLFITVGTVSGVAGLWSQSRFTDRSH